MRFLISARSYHKARQVAFDKGLTPRDFIFIPEDNIKKRYDILLGRRDVSPYYLIGNFSTIEKETICGKYYKSIEYMSDEIPY